MSVDLTDPAIDAAYTSIIQNESLSWLLLSYQKSPDTLSLSASGTKDLEELKESVEEEEVCFGFSRQTFNQQISYILIVFIPKSVSAVRKAHVLVHSRRVGSLFKKHQATLTVDERNSINIAAVRQALINSGSYQLKDAGDSMAGIMMNKALPSSPVEAQAHRSVSDAVDFQVRRTVSEAYNPHPPSYEIAPPRPTKNGVFSDFLRRKKNPSPFRQSLVSANQPPPTPPKDKSQFFSGPTQQENTEHPFVPCKPPPLATIVVQGRTRSSSLSEVALISNYLSSGDDVVAPQYASSPQRALSPRARETSRSQLKRTMDTSVNLDPAEKVRRRVAAQNKRQAEEEEAERLEAERQARLKLEKQQALEEELEEEEHRRAVLEEEIRFISAIRLQKALEMAEEERSRQQELEERKQRERERRLEESRRAEEWRKEQARLANEVARRKEASKRQMEVEKLARFKVVEEQAKSAATSESLVTGWVTIQTGESLVWKRRFYKLIGTAMLFFRGPRDMNVVMDKIELRGRLRRLMEWSDGYEELEAIPHSFAIEFQDGQGFWSIFSDSNAEKEKIQALLLQAAGL